MQRSNFTPALALALALAQILALLQSSQGVPALVSLWHYTYVRLQIQYQAGDGLATSHLVHTPIIEHCFVRFWARAGARAGAGVKLLLCIWYRLIGSC